MTLPSRLPPEIVLHILAYLPISHLSVLPPVSKTWHEFFHGYENSIYHQAAFHHGYINRSSDLLGSVGDKYTAKALADVDTWKKLCQRRTLIHHSWIGSAPSKVQSIPLVTYPQISLPHAHKVHRIKVDEKLRLTMITSQLGGLYVMDMDTGDLLWLLLPHHVRPYAHLEYSNGYLIFDRDDGDKEVWKLIADNDSMVVRPTDFDPSSMPDILSLHEDHVSKLFAATYQRSTSTSVGSETPPRMLVRGVFEPYALLHMPEPSGAFRFVFPNLLIASSDKAYFWDVPSGRINEIVEGIQTSRISTNPTTTNENSNSNPSNENTVENAGQGVIDDDIDGDGAENAGTIPTTLGILRYVDHNADHFFLSGKHLLKVYEHLPRTDQPTSSPDRPVSPRPGRLGLQLSTCESSYGKNHYELVPGTASRFPGSALVKHRVKISQVLRSGASHLRRMYDRFVAVHLSPCGSHFAALLLLGGRLVVVPHFRQYIGKPDWEERMYENALDIHVTSPRYAMGVYLAYEEGDGGVGRISLVTTQGIFVVMLPPFASPSDSSDRTPAPPPQLQISRVNNLMNSSWLWAVSCLMLCDTSLFVNYNPKFARRWPGVMNEGGEIGETTLLLQAYENDDDVWVDEDDSDTDADTVYKMHPAHADRDQATWEMQFEAGLTDFAERGAASYNTAAQRDSPLMEQASTRMRSEVSLVYRIDFLPA